MDLIKNIFLPEKSTQEIKHRYKNLICSKASANPIKEWKNLQYSPLSENEKLQFLRGLKWCSGQEPRFNVISKYFFAGSRSGSLLEQEFLHKDKLNKKRKKHNYEVTHVKYAQLLANYESLDSLLQLANPLSPNDPISKSGQSQQSQSQQQQQQHSSKLDDSNSFSEILSKNSRNQNGQINNSQSHTNMAQKNNQNQSVIKLENSMQMQYPYKKIKQELNSSFSQKPFSHINHNSNLSQEMIMMQQQQGRDRRSSPEYAQHMQGVAYFRQASNGSGVIMANNPMNSSFQMIGRAPQKFKMINNVTYEYEEI